MSKTLTAIVDLVRAGDVRVSDHGYDELAADGIGIKEVLAGVVGARPIEDYPEYPKGPAVLVLQFDSARRPIHLVWGIPAGHDRPAVLVTGYRPNPSRWSEDFLSRRK